MSITGARTPTTRYKLISAVLHCIITSSCRH